MIVIDVPKAHWNAEARRTIYIKLPAEDDEEGMCGLCLKSLKWVPRHGLVLE